MTPVQLGLLDGPRLRTLGLDRVEAIHGSWVQRARSEAVRCARANGSVHVDDIRAWAERTNDKPESSRAWGAVFRSGTGMRWRAAGVRASRHPSNHAHQSPIWTLEET